MEQQQANLIRDVLDGKYDNHPIMQGIYRMLANKSPQERIGVILTLAKEKGIDINAKMFTEDDLKRFGLL